jgi:putative transcription antitermination factor YqgF
MIPVTLAIDYGTKRVGLAISRGSLAEPLEIVSTPEAVSRIQEICEHEHVAQILLGLSENTMAEKTQEFARQLKLELLLPITFVDETLSSYTVHQKTLESGMSRSDRAQPIDHLAAAEFLQEWLDGQ